MRAILTVILSATYATIIATGIFAIGFIATAASKGYGVIDLYAEIFPAFRGPGSAPVPPFAYAVFFAYVAAAAQLAVLYHRRIAARR